MKRHMENRWGLLLAALAGGGLVALLFAGCATIMHGTTQQLDIRSTPTTAKVLIDHTSVGVTPILSTLTRKSSHLVRLELEGYQPYEATISRGVSGWVWGNLVFGGLIGLAVDAVTGGLYQLSPAQIQAEMKKQGVATTLGKDAILVAVVLTPNPAWKRIDSLRPAPRP
jgi:hypothetical protein